MLSILFQSCLLIFSVKLVIGDLCSLAELGAHIHCSDSPAKKKTIPILPPTPVKHKRYTFPLSGHSLHLALALLLILCLLTDWLQLTVYYHTYLVPIHQCLAHNKCCRNFYLILQDPRLHSLLTIKTPIKLKLQGTQQKPFSRFPYHYVWPCD